MWLWNWDRWPSLQRRGNKFFAKLLVSVLLVGFSFRCLFFFSDSFGFLPLSQPPRDSQSVENNGASDTSVLEAALQNGVEDSRKVEVPVEVYHDEEFKIRRWHFRSHNVTISVIWSPFLVKAETFRHEYGVSSSEIEIYLDILDEKWMSQYKNFDYILFSGGPWFLRTAIYWENNRIIGCNSCQEKNLAEISVEYAFRKVLRLVYHFFATSEHKPFIMYRTWAPSHFEYGEWFDGGICSRTVPYKEGEFMGTDLEHLMRGIELEEFKNAVVNGAQLKLLDTYMLSLLRPDGHSGPYRTFHPFDKKKKNATIQNDCLHWCLPGPIDFWNDLIMELVLNGKLK